MTWGKEIKCEACRVFKMQGLPSILSLFRNKFNKSMNVRFYLSYDIKITLKSHFCQKIRYKFCHYVRNVVMDAITVPENL